MPATLTDQKWTAIAEKLAGIKAIQSLIIDNEQQFLIQCSREQAVALKPNVKLIDGRKSSSVGRASLILCNGRLMTC